MKIRILAMLSALILAAPAFALDGGDETGGQPGKSAPAPAKDAKPASKDSPCGPKADCLPTCDGPVAGGDLCAEGTAKKNLVCATLAAVVGEAEAVTKTLGALPEETAKRVEEARKAAFDVAVKIRCEIVGLQKELEACAAEAKAAGKEVDCMATKTIEKDTNALKAKCHASMESFAKLLGETLGVEKVQALGVEVQKAGDVVKAFTAKVEAAAKAAAEAKAAKAKACDEESCDDCEEKCKACDGAAKKPECPAGEKKDCPAEGKPKQ